MIDIIEEYHKYVPLKPDGSPLILPLHADGLSCERGNYAQSARINANNPWQQLQGFTLNIQEWHKRCTLLQDYYDELFGSSPRDKGTLMYLKNYFNHRNVTTNVKDSFNYNEEFLDFCGDGYIILAAMYYMGIEEMNQTPCNFTDDQMAYLNDISSKIMDMVFISSVPLFQRIIDNNAEEVVEDGYEYCTCKTDQGGPMVFCENRNCVRGVWFHLECLEMTEDDVPDGKWFCSERCRKEAATRKSRKSRRRTVAEAFTDTKRNYAIMVIWRSLNQKVRRDAIRENDGNRIILHWKFDMLQFLEKHHPKYFLLGQRLLWAMNGGVSPRLKQTLKWNRTVNPTGGKGKNISMDLQMEFYNKEYKESVKDAAGMLTENTIARHSQMVGIGKELRKVYEKQVSGLSGRRIHKSTEVKRDEDLAAFVSVLGTEDFFSHHPGRKLASYPDMDLNLYPNIVPRNAHSRLTRLTKVMSKRRQLILNMQRHF